MWVLSFILFLLILVIYSQEVIYLIILLSAIFVITNIGLIGGVILMALFSSNQSKGAIFKAKLKEKIETIRNLTKGY